MPFSSISLVKMIYLVKKSLNSWLKNLSRKMGLALEVKTMTENLKSKKMKEKRTMRKNLLMMVN